MRHLDKRSEGGSERCRRWGPQLPAALIGTAVLLLAALPAWSARVVDVRVGKHAKFTRVVFELDAPTGYKLERSEPVPGVAEIVVKLRASAASGAVEPPRQPLVDDVVIDFDGRISVARIRLADSDLEYEKMILSQPPRIVLDVLAPEGTTLLPVAQAEPEAPEPAAIEEPEPEPVMAEATGPEPQTGRVDAAQAEVGEEEPELEPVPTPQVEVVEVETPDPGPTAAGEREPVGLAAAEDASDAAMPSDPTAPAPADSVPVVEVPTPEPARTARTTQPPASARSALPPAPVPEPASGGGLFSVRNAVLAALGIVLLVAGGYVVARRRSGRVDDDELADGFDDDNPFAGLEGEAPAEDAGYEEEQPERAAGSATDSIFGEATGEAGEAQAGLFDAPDPDTERTRPVEIPTQETIGFDDHDDDDADREKRESAEEATAMTMDTTSGFGADPDAVTAMPGGAADNDAVMSLVRELESRISNLETRLEEAVDARERLERQVAAQTEELRVQRAAIARTQRAVRNLSQPVEDTPTEPALRQPQAE